MNSRKNKKRNPFSIREGRYGKLAGFSYRLGWTEDSYIPNSNQYEVVGRIFDFSKIRWIIYFLIICCSLILFRAFWLQLVKGEYYYSLAEGNRIKTEIIEPRRGVIYDKNLNPLAINVPNFLLYFSPQDLPKDKEECKKIADKVCKILETDCTEILNKLKEAEEASLKLAQPVFIADSIPYEKAIKFYLNEYNLPGVVIINKTKREYKLSSLSLSHILGYTGKINEEELKKFGDEYSIIDYVGKTGLEYFWENELRGSKGERQIEVDALGREKKIINTIKENDGRNLVLSLDTALQKKIEEILNNYFDKYEVSRASVIALNPNNGEILSLVSLPSYNNNSFVEGISSEEYQKLINDPDQPLFNRSIIGEYPSGSTFKPIVAIAALEEGIISEWTSFLSIGGIWVGPWFFPDWRAGGHGITNVRKALADSVNTFFYYIGGGYKDFVGLGAEKIANYARLFGLGAQTGIDLPGERAGFLPSEEWKEETKGEPWYIGDTYHFAIGQGDILVTPLQVANYTSVFANGGSLYRPHLVKEILNCRDEHVEYIDTAPIRSDFVDPYNIKIVRQGMRQAITSGSATSLQAVPTQVAGKTGTAQWSTKKNPHAWFTGFAPYDNPEIVLTVLIEEGAGNVHLAIPVAREILTWYFSQGEGSKK